MDRRVIVFGIDGATWDNIDPFLAEGVMPRLASIVAEGMRGTLASTVPPLTAPAWTSLLTGRRPENHGILAFFLYELGTYKRRLASWRHARGPYVWDTIGSAGKSVGLVNIPVTWPPAPVRGFHITGMMTPAGAKYTHPPELARELEKDLDYEVDHSADGLRADMDRERFAQDLFRVSEKQVRASLRLFERHPTDFFMLVLMGADRLQHGFYHLFDAAHPAWSAEEAARHGGLLRDYYRHLDRALGEFQDRMGPDDVLLVVSDHGSAPVYGRWKINRWLESLGWLASIPPNSLTALAHGALRSLRKMDILDLGHRLPLAIQERLPTAVRNHDATSQIDWSRTKAYCPEPACRGIYINLAGRDAMGVVQPGVEYEALRRSIRDALLEVRVPGSGDAVFPRVCLREEVYRGTFADRAPDIVFDLHDHYNVVARLEEGPLLDVERAITGDHTSRGILAAWGKGIRHGEVVQGAHIWDVGPTILSLLGIPVPLGLDGQPLAVEEPQPIGVG